MPRPHSIPYLQHSGIALPVYEVNRNFDAAKWERKIVNEDKANGSRSYLVLEKPFKWAGITRRYMDSLGIKDKDGFVEYYVTKNDLKQAQLKTSNSKRKLDAIG